MKAALIALASVLLPVPVAPAIPQMVVIEPSAIVQVICVSSDGMTAGTAYRIGPDLMLTASHVTSGNGDCFIGRDPVRVAWKSPDADFTELHGGPGPYLSVDCGGFVKGKKYLSVGFARGQSPVTSVELTATGEYDDDNGQAILVGMVPIIPGMSGGPLVDEETGKVVGVNNMENFEQGLSWSVELKGTPVCKGGIA
jgi:hypothetical protein